jgi:hypothetical protein
MKISCECGNEPSGFIKCWETIELVVSGVVLSFIEIVFS